MKGQAPPENKWMVCRQDNGTKH